MSQPKNAFNEVRAILGKLDRSREELRQKPAPTSENTRPAPANPSAFVPAATTPAPAQASRPVAAPPTARPPVPPTPGSKYGRAQPIRPSGDALGRWSPPTP